MNRIHTLIIGATRGLGREIAKTLQAERHLISAVGRNLADNTKIPGVHYYLTDLTDSQKFANTLKKIIKQNGKLNHLVFCQRFRGQEKENWQGEISIALTATKNIIEQLKDEFSKDSDNSIVVISSIISNFIGLEQPVSYHVAKSGLIQLVRYYAVVLGPSGIRVNSVSPGTFVKEESRDFYEKNSKLQDLYKKITPLGRMNTSADIANVVSFLVNPKSSFITGQNIIVDGGISLHSHETLARSLINYQHPNIKNKK